MALLRRLLYEALIVPEAHTRVFDADFQLEVYEVFHTRRTTRWMHILCTVIVNVSLLAAASAIPIPWLRNSAWNVDGAVLGAAIAFLGYFAVHGAWAVATAPVLLIAIGLAHILAAILGASVVSHALGIAFAAAFVQAFSHGFEPVPPPWSGGYHWISIREFLFRTPKIRILRLTMASFLIYPLLEMWASPRIWPVQVLHFLMKAGFHPVLASRTRERVRQILADPRNGWALPFLSVETDSGS